MPPTVTKAQFNIFTSPTSFSNILVSQYTLLIIPEPAALSLISLAMIGAIGFERRHRRD
jgi:hypothetical protein